MLRVPVRELLANPYEVPGKNALLESSVSAPRKQRLHGYVGNLPHYCISSRILMVNLPKVAIF